MNSMKYDSELGLDKTSRNVCLCLRFPVLSMAVDGSYKVSIKANISKNIPLTESSAAPPRMAMRLSTFFFAV